MTFKTEQVVDYGLVYWRDPVFSQDDISWFLRHKQAGLSTSGRYS